MNDMSIRSAGATLTGIPRQAVKNAAATPPTANPRAAANAAAAAAARKFAPGFLTGAAGAAIPSAMASGRGRSGRWIRRGNRIILFGV